MDKNSLPKLEMDGFTSYTKGYAYEDVRKKTSWRSRASDVMRRAGVPARGKARDAVNDEEVDPAYRKLLIKTGICAGLAVVLLVISTINTPEAQNVTDTVNQVVNHEFDIDKDIGRLKFVQTLDETEAVFSAQPDALAVYPADGRVVTAFGEDGSKGVRIEASGNVSCIAKATVTAVGEIGSMGYVELTLDTGETLVYHNIEPAVQVKDIVAPGQTVGAVTGNYLYLEMLSGDAYIDPLAYVQKEISGELQ